MCLPAVIPSLTNRRFLFFLELFILLQLIMYATTKNSFQKKPLLSQMCIICLHLTQRFLTTRFFAGLFTGILFTVIFYHGKEPKEGLKFRADQSKFEYQGNQYASVDANLNEASIWNHTWDRFAHTKFFFISL